MITVIGYRNGKECRHEICYDLWSADQVAEEMKECTSLYDEVRIVLTEEQNGTTR